MNVDRIFKALGDPHRLIILRLMIEEKQSLCVCELVTVLGLPQYQVSRHLGVLKKLNLVKVQKIGTWAYHSFNGALPINNVLADFLVKAIPKKELDAEFKKMKDRLALRFNGKCVVGFEEELSGTPILPLPRGVKKVNKGRL